MKFLLPFLLAFISFTSVAQTSWDYLLMQHMGVDILIASTVPSFDRRVDLGSTPSMKDIKEHQARSLRMILGLVQEFEEQGWQLYQFESTTWLFRRARN